VLAALLLAGCGKSHLHADADDAGSPSRRDASVAAGSSKKPDRDASESDSGSDGSDAARPVTRHADGGSARDDGSADEMPAELGEDAATCANGDCLDAASPNECADASAAASPPTVLFIYDRSSSMASAWAGTSRADAVHEAVAGALAPLASALTVGALFFPSVDPDAPPMCIDPSGVACTLVPGLVTPSGTCDVNMIGEPDQIDLRSGERFLGALDEMLTATTRYAPVPNGETPLLEALQEAQRTLAGVAPDHDDITVIVITDGAPNCAWDASAAQAVIDDWFSAGIELDVLTLAGTESAGVANSLRSVPSGHEPTFFDAANADALEQKLSDILSSRNGGQQDCPRP
jgi:hypothetical protein